ncbi:MAG TPA: dihydrofolate reductase family protein [Terriglobales bacterium]
MYASVFVGTSLDGFIARPSGAFDFLPAGGGEPHGYNKFMASVDALVIGRNTYDVVLGFPKWPYSGKRVFVLGSRGLGNAPENADVTHLQGEPLVITAELQRCGIQHAYVDGGITIQRFVRANAIQRFIITKVPVLIGEGIALFGAVNPDVHLRHIATRSFASGLVQSEYHLEGTFPPRFLPPAQE